MSDPTETDRERTRARQDAGAPDPSDPGEPGGAPPPARDGEDDPVLAKASAPDQRADHRTTPEEIEEALAGVELTGEMDRLQAELDALNDRHLRLAAEFTNYRRRADSERLEAWGRAQADLVRRLVDVLDDLQRVESLDPADPAVTVESIVEGVDLVERKFFRALEDAGAEVVDPGDGEPFDPEHMEAVMRAPTDDEALDDTVSQVFQKGYVFQGHLVRPARVSVYKAD
jgi:molecular chaperone GrpE